MASPRCRTRRALPSQRATWGCWNAPNHSLLSATVSGMFLASQTSDPATLQSHWQAFGKPAARKAHPEDHRPGGEGRTSLMKLIPSLKPRVRPPLGALCFASAASRWLPLGCWCVLHGASPPCWLVIWRRSKMERLRNNFFQFFFHKMLDVIHSDDIYITSEYAYDVNTYMLARM